MSKREVLLTNFMRQLWLNVTSKQEPSRVAEATLALTEDLLAKVGADTEEQLGEARAALRGILTDPHALVHRRAADEIVLGCGLDPDKLRLPPSPA